MRFLVVFEILNLIIVLLGTFMEPKGIHAMNFRAALVFILRTDLLNNSL